MLGRQLFPMNKAYGKFSGWEGWLAPSRCDATQTVDQPLELREFGS